MLPARLAGQVADAGFLVDLDGDRGLVAAEEAAEGGRKGFALVEKRQHQHEVARSRWRIGACRTFLGPVGLRDDFLRLPWFVLR